MYPVSTFSFLNFTDVSGLYLSYFLTFTQKIAMDIVWLASGVILGFIIGYLLVRFILTVRNTEKQSLLNQAEKQLAILSERLESLQLSKENAERELKEQREKATMFVSDLGRKETEIKNMEEKLLRQKEEVEALQKRFREEFENLANRIFEEKSRKFSDQNRTNLDMILSPLKEKISLFEKKVEDTYQRSLKDQTDLKAELKSLHELNIKISEDATNLTKALKGDIKKQGNWGEIVLERVLERSGLTRGVEYETQSTTRNEEGEMIRPDVIVYLPEKKHIIIDSKVSLVAYEHFVNTDDEGEKNVFLKQHVESIKNHIKALSDKNYQMAGDLSSPDFVLLFMPVESAFSAAVQAEQQLFNYAWERKIVIVSPSTLLATLKTVESIWRQEKQTQNAMEIARQGGNLYDKFVAFIDDMDKLGSQIHTTGKTYEEVMKKLSTGRGNLVSRASKLRKLGVKASKALPDKYKWEEENNLEEEKEK